MRVYLRLFWILLVYSLYICCFDCLAVSNPDQFAVGDLVAYGTELHYVQQVQNTHLRFKSYQVNYLKTGELLYVWKLLLSKPVVEDILLESIDWDTEIDETPVVEVDKVATGVDMLSCLKYRSMKLQRLISVITVRSRQNELWHCLKVVKIFIIFLLYIL